jgi:hypothetical protein
MRSTGEMRAEFMMIIKLRNSMAGVPVSDLIQSVFPSAPDVYKDQSRRRCCAPAALASGWNYENAWQPIGCGRIPSTLRRSMGECNGAGCRETAVQHGQLIPHGYHCGAPRAGAYSAQLAARARRYRMVRSTCKDRTQPANERRLEQVNGVRVEIFWLGRIVAFAGPTPYPSSRSAHADHGGTG